MLSDTSEMNYPDTPDTDIDLGTVGDYDTDPCDMKDEGDVEDDEDLLSRYSI